MKLEWACDFYNIRSVYHFESEILAEEYGKKSGLQFVVYRV